MYQKTAPENYKDGNYNVLTKNWTIFKENIDKLAEIKASSVASVDYKSKYREARVERNGNLYTVIVTVIDPKGKRETKREQVTKANFEAFPQSYI